MARRELYKTDKLIVRALLSKRNKHSKKRKAGINAWLISVIRNRTKHIVCKDAAGRFLCGKRVNVTRCRLHPSMETHRARSYQGACPA